MLELEISASQGRCHLYQATNKCQGSRPFPSHCCPLGHDQAFRGPACLRGSGACHNPTDSAEMVKENDVDEIAYAILTSMAWLCRYPRMTKCI